MTEDQAKTKGRPRAGTYEESYPISEKLEALSIPEPNSGCHLWTGALNDSGYGRVKVRSRFKRAHIAAYEVDNGDVPPGMVLDHICRTRSCVNPAHLEPVTHLENLKRGCLARGSKWRRPE